MVVGCQGGSPLDESSARGAFAHPTEGGAAAIGMTVSRRLGVARTSIRAPASVGARFWFWAVSGATSGARRSVPGYATVARSNLCVWVRGLNPRGSGVRMDADRLKR